MINIPALTLALQAIGNAHVYAGDFTTIGGAVAFGHKEGPISLGYEEMFSDLTATEVTGPAIHARTLMGVRIFGTIPCIIDDTMWAKITGSGTKGAGWSSPIQPVYTSLAIIPDNEVAGGLANTDGTDGTWGRTAGFGYAGASGASAAPKNAHWIWKASLSRGEATWTYENGGKMIIPVSFVAIFDPTKPEANKQLTVGNPIAAGITGFRM